MLKTPAFYALLVTGSVSVLKADLVAYWPLKDGEPGTPVSATGADDVIDNPDHGATDAVAQGPNDTWALDPVRGVVLSTTEGSRLLAGKQDIDMAKGFTWSLWAKVARSNKTDSGTIR